MTKRTPPLTAQKNFPGILYVCLDSLGNLRAFTDIIDVTNFVGEYDKGITVAQYHLSHLAELKKQFTYVLVQDKEK